MAFAKQRTGVRTWTAYWKVWNPETREWEQRSKGGFKDERKAVRHGNEQEVDARRSPYVRTTRLTVAEFLETWLEDYGRRKGPSTYAGYAVLLRNHVIPVIGPLPIKTLEPAHIKQVYAAVRRKCRHGVERKRGTAHEACSPLSESTVHHVHAALHVALEHAVSADWRLLPANPMHTLLDTPRQPRSRKPIYDASGLLRLLAAVDAYATDPGLPVLYRLTAYTGLRRGEARGLRWGDVDWEHNTITVSRVREWVSGQGDLVLDRPKTEGSERTLSLVPEVMAALRAYGRGLPDAWVFPWGAHALAARLRSLRRHIHDPEVLAVFAGQPLHGLRHTIASHLLREGAAVTDVQELLGHSSPAVTLGTYSHAVPGGRRRTAALFADGIARAREEASNG